MIELMLMGIKEEYHLFGFGAKVIGYLIQYACSVKFQQIWTYADWRALGFFYKQGFKEIQLSSSERNSINERMGKCLRSNLVCLQVQESVVSRLNYDQSEEAVCQESRLESAPS